MPLPVPPPAIGPRSPEPRLTAAVRLRARKPDDAPTSRKSSRRPSRLYFICECVLHLFFAPVLGGSVNRPGHADERLQATFVGVATERPSYERSETHATPHGPTAGGPGLDPEPHPALRRPADAHRDRPRTWTLAKPRLWSGTCEPSPDADRIEILPHKNRGIRLLEDDIPLISALAEVAAGTPIVCDAHTVERVPRAIAEQFRPRPDYLLTVRGDSMDRVVRDGDIVAVHKTPEAKTGQIVVARFGDEVTLKRFARIDERHVELHPESHNTAYKVLKLDLAMHILQIDGVVVGAIIRELDDTREKISHK